MRYPVGTLEGQEQIGREKQDTSSSILLRVLEDLTKKESNKSQPFKGSKLPWSTQQASLVS